MPQVSAWYRDRSDGIPTLDLDPDANVKIEIDFNGRYTSPVSGVAEADNVPEDGGAVTVSEIEADDDGMTFRAIGSGALITFRVSYGDDESDDFTIRLRSKEN